MTEEIKRYGEVETISDLQKLLADVEEEFGDMEVQTSYSGFPIQPTAWPRQNLLEL